MCYSRPVTETIYTETTLKKAVESSSSFSDVLRYFGKGVSSGSLYSHIVSKIRRFGIDTSHFVNRHSKRGTSPRRISAVLRLVHNPDLTKRVRSSILRRSLIETGRLHECSVCGQEPSWRGYPLVLQVDHINGDWKDNTPENLRFLCPNCHSQESLTHEARNRKHSKCTKSPRLPRRVVLKGVWPSDKDLSDLVWSKPVTQVARSVGVTNSAVKRYCKRRGINTPPRGHWSKQR